MFENARALIIAVNEYEDPKIPNLKFPLSDANALALRLLENGFRNENIVTISGDAHKKATRCEIYMALNNLARTLRKADKKQSDLVLIYFAGHADKEQDLFDLSPYRMSEEGQPLRNSPSRKLQYLLPSDAICEHLNGTAIELESFKNMINNLRADQIALLIDACYAGAEEERGVPEQGRKIEVMPLMGKGKVYIASSSGSQTSREDSSLNHGVFTYYLLEAMGGMAECEENGLVYHDAVAKYVHRRVAEYSENDQTPELDVRALSPPGVALGINTEKYFVNQTGKLGDPDIESYLRQRGVQALRDVSNHRMDLAKIRDLIKDLVKNRVELRDFFAKVQRIDIEYLAGLKESGEISDSHLGRIVLAAENTTVTEANRQINKEAQRFLCGEVALAQFIHRMQEIDQDYIRGNITVPFSPNIRDELCKSTFAKGSASPPASRFKEILRDVAAGKSEVAEFRKQVVEVAWQTIRTSSINKLSMDQLRHIYSALQWSQAVPNSQWHPMLAEIIERCWEISLGKMNINHTVDRQILADAVKSFAELSKDLQDRFKRATSFVNDSKYQEAAKEFLELSKAGCPPPPLLFGEAWKQLEKKMTLPAYLQTFALEGKYAEITETLANVDPIFTFSQKLQEVADEEYFARPALPLFKEKNPYQVLRQHNIRFHSSRQEIKQLKITPEPTACKTLRSIEKRLFIDWQLHPVSDPQFLRRVAEDARAKMGIPGKELFLELMRPENVTDILIVLMVADEKAEARRFLRDTLRDQPAHDLRGNLIHFLGLCDFSEAANTTASIEDEQVQAQFRCAIASLVMNLMDDGFWEEFKRRRQNAYDRSIENSHIASVKTNIRNAIDDWFTQRISESLSSGKANQAEIYKRLSLEFTAEIRGAELLKRVGGIQLSSGSEAKFFGGRLGVEFFNLREQLEGIINREQNLSSGSIASGSNPLSDEELKLFPCLFSEFNFAVALRDERPEEALKLLRPLLSSFDRSDYVNFVRLIVDILNHLAANQLGQPKPPRENILAAIGHWREACQFAQQIEREAITRIQILNQVAGRAEYLYLQAQSDHRRPKEIIELDRVAIDLIENVQNQLFLTHESYKDSKNRLDPILSKLYLDLGIALCNHFDDYQGGVKYLRKSVDLYPYATRLRSQFLIALLNAADSLLLQNRKTESKIYYEEAKRVAEIGEEQQAGIKEFIKFKERAERGLKGEIDII